MTAAELPPESDRPTGRDRLLQATLDYFAEHGIGNVSLRQIAAGIGSSHRMLIYHFGSREGLLTAVVDVLEAGEKQILADMMAEQGVDGRIMAWNFWSHIADVADFYGPLYFELASQAMRSDDLDAPLRLPNVEMWVDALAEMWSRAGVLGNAEARAQARLNLAVARGLLHDLLLTHDREAVAVAMARFDFLSFGGAPHPLAEVRRRGRRWVVPTSS